MTATTATTATTAMAAMADDSYTERDSDSSARQHYSFPFNFSK